MIADKLRSINKASGGGGPFDPSQLPGLNRWYSATNVVLSGSSVSQITDKSGGGNHATQSTSTKQPVLLTNQGNGFNTIAFDGVDDIVNFAAMTLTGDFTVYWIGFMRETNSNAGGFFGEGEGLQPSLNTWNQGTYWHTASGDIVQGNDGLVVNGTFVKLVARRTGTTITIEVNGTNNSTQPANANPTIGEIGYVYSGYAKIDLCEFLVYSQYHSNTNRDQFLGWVDANYPDPYFKNTSLLLHMDGVNGSTTFVDSGPNALAVTATNATISTTQSKFGEASGSFNGSGSAYLSIADSDLFYLPGDFTIEAWVWIDGGTSAIQSIYSQRESGAYGFQATITYNAGVYQQWMWIDSTHVVTYRSGSSIAASQWVHLAWSRSGSTVRTFINGVQNQSVTYSATPRNEVAPVVIGECPGYTQPFKGLIDDLRITKGVAHYTSNFTPPPKAFPNLYNPYTTLPVSGAALWLDASQQTSLFTDAGVTNVISNGQAIYQWNDLSGNNRHATQATLANRPTWKPPASGQNGFGTVGFNGTSQWMDISMPSLAAGYTIYAVLKNGSPLASQNAFCTAGAGTNNVIATVYSDSTQIGLSQYGASVLQAATANTVIGFVGKYDGSHATGNYLVRNSTAASNAIGTMTQNTGTPAAGTANIGRSTNASQYFANPIMELIVFDSYRSSADDAAIKAYFTSKWGINWA